MIKRPQKFSFNSDGNVSETKQNKTERNDLELAIKKKKEDSFKFFQDIIQKGDSMDIKTLIESEKKLKKENIELKNEISRSKNSFLEQKKSLEVELKLSKEESRILRRQILSDSYHLREEDLNFNINLKKRKCFHIKDVTTAKKLNGITSIKDLENIIDKYDFQDIKEVENTLNCLESIIYEWKDGKFISNELDQDLDITINSTEWKQKDLSILVDVILNNYHQDFIEFNKKMEEGYHQKRSKMKGSANDVYISVIQEILTDWKNNNTFNEEIIFFIKLVPPDKDTIQKMKSKFEWKMIPKWELRREKLNNMLKLNWKIPRLEGGLLIEN